MTAEQNVASLEPCMELHKRGVRLETFFRWVCNKDGTGSPWVSFGASNNMLCTYYPAPTAEELASVLRMTVYFPAFVPQGNGGWCSCHEPIGDSSHYEFADTLVDAIAQMLLWLIDEGHITTW